MMSEITDDDALLAAEYALGLLDEPERRVAEARIEAEPSFARDVEWWREQLGTFDAGPVAPPARLWRAIETRLGANDDDAKRSGGDSRRWKWATAALAAALLGVIVLRPTPAPVEVRVPVERAAAQPLVASLTGARGTTVTVAYDRDTRRVLVTPARLLAGTRDAELWVIPLGSATPVSLGVIDAGKPRSRDIEKSVTGLIAEGATLAISLEPRGGSTTGAPTGPVVATGKIVRV